MAYLKRNTSTRYYIGTGKSRKRLEKWIPGAYAKKEKSEHWWLVYKDANGKRQQKKLSRYKEIAEIEKGNFLKELEHRRVGIISDHVVQAGRPLSEHIDDWETTIKERRINPRRPVEMLKRVRKLVKIAKWERLTDISVDSTNAALGKLKIGAETRNHYRQHIKQFILWCVPDRLLVNPLTKLKRENAEVDKRHERRALSPEEQTELIRTTKAENVVRFKMDGATRAMLYDVAFATGLRRGELKSLKRGSFNLKEEILTLGAAYSKHRETDVLPLPPWLVERLKTWFEEGRGLWPDLTRHTGKMFRADLEAAGIDYVIEGPDGKLYADFHSTRHSYVSSICQTEGSQKDQMEMTRHKSAQLFLRTYGKTTKANVRRIALQLPDPLAEPKTDNEQKSAS